MLNFFKKEREYIVKFYAYKPFKGIAYTFYTAKNKKEVKEMFYKERKGKIIKIKRGKL